MDRAFKGIWIPKEIWLSEELTLQEKVFLVEIDSLDNENGCFASNSYFAEFFGLSNSRASQVINSLKAKGFIDIAFEREKRQITKRIIKINRPPYPYLECYTPIQNPNEGIKNPNGGVKFPKGGIKETKEGYLENCEDNNTSINNTDNNIFNNTGSIYGSDEPTPAPKKVKPVKHKYGEYEHVLLSDEERNRLFEEKGECETLEAIKFLDEYIEMYGKKYKNHNLVLRKWVFDAVREKKEKNPKPQQNTGSSIDGFANAYQNIMERMGK